MQPSPANASLPPQRFLEFQKPSSCAAPCSFDMAQVRRPRPAVKEAAPTMGPHGLPLQQRRNDTAQQSLQQLPMPVDPLRGVLQLLLGSFSHLYLCKHLTQDTSACSVQAAPKMGHTLPCQQPTIANCWLWVSHRTPPTFYRAPAALHAHVLAGLPDRRQRNPTPSLNT